MTTSQTNFFRTVLAFLLLLVIASWPLSTRSQSTTPSLTQSPTALHPDAPASLRFEVASIRPRQFDGEEPSNRQMLPGGRFVATATTARTLIRIAFGAEDNRISGAPKWIDNEIFDINAITVNHDEVTTPQQFQQLMLSLLQDRFQLKFHREQIETAVYWLELVKPGKLGPDLKQSSPDSQPNMSTNSNGARTVMKISKMSMADIAAGLRRQSGRPVEDHTGLKGDFDFQIEWAPEENPDSADPSLFTVLKEQLGLRLRSAKGTAESIVIDQISLPSAN
jgi:uncharacterized protein (TIGR03435 family)